MRSQVGWVWDVICRDIDSRTMCDVITGCPRDPPPGTRLSQSIWTWYASVGAKMGQRRSQCVPTLVQNCIKVSKQCFEQPSNTRRCSSVDLMMGQRRRRWTNIKSALVQRLVFAILFQHHPKAGSSSRHKTVPQWWSNVGSPFSILALQ